MNAHNADIVGQFTLQAELFKEKHSSSEEVYRLIVETSRVTSGDDVLDVACGPGLVACALATRARHVVGVDITPAMLDSARRLQAERGLANMDWREANAEALPFDDESFDLVVTRYSFHHFERPARVLAEMKRVCKRGSRVVVIDATPDAAHAAGYNLFEKLRDSSHVRAMPPEELVGLVREGGLSVADVISYVWEVDAERQIRASFPKPGDEERIRALIADDVESGRLGMGAHRHGDAVMIGYPTTVIVAVR